MARLLRRGAGCWQRRCASGALRGLGYGAWTLTSYHAGPLPTLAAMTRLRVLAAVALSALALSACGGGGGGSEPVAAVSAPSLASVAQKAGCASIEETSEELFVREGGTCMAGADEVTAHTYADAKARDSWLEAAGSFGGVIVVGDLWTVGVDSADAAQRVQAKTGGEIR